MYDERKKLVRSDDWYLAKMKKTAQGLDEAASGTDSPIDADRILRAAKKALSSRDAQCLSCRIRPLFKDASCLETEEGIPREAYPHLKSLLSLCDQMNEQFAYERDIASRDALCATYLIFSGTAWPEMPLSSFRLLRSLTELPEGVNRVARVFLPKTVPAADNPDGTCTVRDDTLLMDADFDFLIRVGEEWQELMDVPKNACPPMHAGSWNGCEPGYRRTSYPDLPYPV